MKIIDLYPVLDNMIRTPNCVILVFTLLIDLAGYFIMNYFGESYCFNNEKEKLVMTLLKQKTV